MILIGYVVEFFILYLWYKYIIKCELISSGIFRRSKKILFMQEKVSISHLLNPDRINDEQRKIMDYFRKVISDLLESTYMFIGYIILGPFICKSVFSDEEHVLWNILGYIILLCLLIISRLIEDTQKIVNVINSYTQHLMIPLEKDPELLYNENCIFRLNGTASPRQRKGCPLQTGSLLLVNSGYACSFHSVQGGTPYE